MRRSRAQVVPRLDDYLEHEWTQTFPRRERTDDTNKERIKRLLFPSPRGRVWNPDNFQARVWRPAMRRAESDFTLYDLRHTFASRLLSAGIPLVEVSAWMGHRVRAGGLEAGGGSTTSRSYAHGTGEWRAAALGELNAIIRRQTDAQRELPHLRSI